MGNKKNSSEESSVTSFLGEKKNHTTSFIAKILFRFEQGRGKHEYSLDYWTKMPG